MRRHSSSRFLVAPAALAVVGLFSSGLPAADRSAPLPPLMDQVRVEVVNVDVVVTDKQGIPVAGLTADDFEVFEDGKVRPISNFFSFTDGRAQDLEAIEQTDGKAGGLEFQNNALMRRMAILFDFNTLEKRTRDQAIESLEQFIREQFDGTYEWAVVGYGDRVRVLQPFSSDKSTVIGSLLKLKQVPVQLRQARATDQTFSENQPYSARTQAIGRRPALDEPGSRILGPEAFELRERMMQGLRVFGKTAGAITETMRAYAALPGRKSLVLVTGALEGLPSGPQLLGFGLPGVGGGEGVDPVIGTLNTELQEIYSGIIKTANAAGFAIYPVATPNDTRTHSPQIDVTRERSAVFVASNQQALATVDVENAPNIMAAGTGGIYYKNTRFFAALDDIDDRTSNSYVLGFETDHAADQEYHKIRVKVKQPGLRVKSREGYLHLTQRDKLVEEMATSLLFPKARGDFQVAVQVQPPEGSEKKMAVKVAGVIGIGDLTLVPQGEQMVGRIFLLAAVYDSDGALHKLVHEQQEVRFSEARLAEFPADAPARFVLEIPELEHGEYTMTVTVMDEISDRYGTGFQPVQL